MSGQRREGDDGQILSGILACASAHRCLTVLQRDRNTVVVRSPMWRDIAVRLDMRNPEAEIAALASTLSWHGATAACRAMVQRVLDALHLADAPSLRILRLWDAVSDPAVARQRGRRRFIEPVESCPSVFDVYAEAELVLSGVRVGLVGVDDPAGTKGKDYVMHIVVGGGDEVYGEYLGLTPEKAAQGLSLMANMLSESLSCLRSQEPRVNHDVPCQLGHVHLMLNETAGVDAVCYLAGTSLAIHRWEDIAQAMTPEGLAAAARDVLERHARPN